MAENPLRRAFCTCFSFVTPDRGRERYGVAVLDNYLWATADAGPNFTAVFLLRHLLPT